MTKQISINRVAEKMIQLSKGNIQDINHFLKVTSYCRIIGLDENLSEEEMYTLEIAALIHDIACPYCRGKYGKCPGRLQEIESEHLILDFFKDEEIAEKIKKRIIYIISHHHSPTYIDNIDFQILIEADYIVNAYESNYPIDSIRETAERIFKTPCGKRIIKSMFNIE